MDISIIIPVHNLENHITKCLDCVAMQNYDKEKFEVLPVLDSCTDGTKEKILAWTARWPEINVKILEGMFDSPGFARNAGLDNASGQFIAFIDGDDYWARSDALSILMAAAQGGTAVYQKRFQNNEGIQTGEKRERDTVWRFLIPMSMIGDTRFSNMHLHEDLAFFSKLRMKTGVWKENLIEDVLYHYSHPRDGSITTELERGRRRKQGESWSRA